MSNEENQTSAADGQSELTAVVMPKESVFQNNCLIMREGEGSTPKFSFDRIDGKLVVTQVVLDGYTILPNEQYQAMKGKYDLEA